MCPSSRQASLVRASHLREHATTSEPKYVAGVRNHYRSKNSRSLSTPRQGQGSEGTIRIRGVRPCLRARVAILACLALDTTQRPIE